MTVETVETEEVEVSMSDVAEKDVEWEADELENGTTRYGKGELIKPKEFSQTIEELTDGYSLVTTVDR